MMDFDGAWDAWEDAGHGDCGGWKYDPGPAVIRCACGEFIPVPAALAAEASGADCVGPGTGWLAEHAP